MRAGGEVVGEEADQGAMGAIKLIHC